MESAKHYGTSRVEFAKNVKSKEDWNKWEEPKHSFAFDWGSCWKSTVEYKTENYEAEVGFFIDILGCDCNTISDDYTMVMGPKHEFYLSIRKPKTNEPPTPSDAITIEFMVKDMKKTVEELKSRGISFTQEATPDAPDSPMMTSEFKTPHGLKIKLWSFEKA